MKNLFFVSIVFVALLGFTSLSCSNKKDMSKKKNVPAEDQPISPQTEGTSTPTRQVNPMSLPQDTAKPPSDKNRSIPIGIPISAEEMERLKKESNKPSAKTPKQKPPDNNL
jgi:hypothetical protein